MATQSDRNNSWRSSPPNGKREGRDKENGETRLSLLVGVVVVVGVDCDNAYLADSCSVKGVHNMQQGNGVDFSLIRFLVTHV